MQSARYFTKNDRSGFQKMMSGFQKTTNLVWLPKILSESWINLTNYLSERTQIGTICLYMFIYVCKGSSLGQESIVDYVDVLFAIISAFII
jgi:hypothetical protein